MYVFLFAECLACVLLFSAPLPVLMRAHFSLFALYMLIKALEGMMGRFSFKGLLRTIKGLIRSFLVVVVLSFPLPFLPDLLDLDRGLATIGLSLILSGAICMFAEQKSLRFFSN